VGGLKEFSIPFRGLGEGKHDFEFVADNSFFEHFDSAEIEKGRVNIHVELVRHSRFLELHFNLAGNVTVQCDRCLSPLSMGIEHRAVLYVRFGEKTMEQSDEIFILAESASELRLEQFIFEYIHLALPYRRIHPEKDGHAGCDPEMMKKIIEHRAHEEDQSEDPRWNKLKGLIHKTK